nr:MAG TPA: hypothetical protein [Caudoviricetes sp.]
MVAILGYHTFVSKNPIRFNDGSMSSITNKKK